MSQADASASAQGARRPEKEKRIITENAGDVDNAGRIPEVSAKGCRVVEHKELGSPAPRFCPAGLWLQSLGVGLIFEACIPNGIALAEASAEC